MSINRYFGGNSMPALALLAAGHREWTESLSEKSAAGSCPWSCSLAVACIPERTQWSV